MGNATTKEKYINDIKNNKKYDPYVIFQLQKNFTWDQLKKSYKKLAIKTHPDKGGNKIIFDYITQLFYELANDYRSRNNNNTHANMKNNFNNYSENNFNNNNFNENNDNYSFNDLINKNFEKVRIRDDDIDFGYGDTMVESSDIRDDIDIDNLFKDKKINNKSFNEVFNKNVKITNNIIKYTEPTPMILSKNLNYSEIGAGKNSDYSSSIEKTNSLAYTDYMKAHTTSRLVDISEFDNIKKFKNTQEYKKYSDKKIKKKLTEKELNILEKHRNKEENHENERLNRIKKQNIKIEESYNLANRLLLK